MGSPRFKALLVQVRSHEGARLHEQSCFRESGAMSEDELDFFNVVEPDPMTWSAVEPYDVLFLGGAGDHSATDIHEFSEPLREVVLRWVAEERPLLGSCWGHHFLAWSLGGRVITDPEQEEIGTIDLDLTSAGRRDPLLTDLPDCFPAHQGHHDVVAGLPAGTVELARSERCGFQILRVEDKPAYTTQFHSEMNERHMRERLHMYRKSYLPEDLILADFERMLRPTTEVASLLERFLELYT